MSPRPAAPFKIFTFQNGATAPWYILPFDKDGNCIGPQTLEHLQNAARQGNFTDIHIFSHGWNNVFDEALDLYQEFWSGYFKMRDDLNLNDPANYRPLIVGIVWPSTALVGQDEQTPEFAGGEDSLEPELAELTRELSEADAARLRILASKSELSREETLELARILLPIYNRAEPDGFAAPDAAADTLTPEQLVEVWSKTDSQPRFANLSGAAGALPDEDADRFAAPAAAGLLDLFNPKKIVRVATVYQMKDRAGTVGANGVAAMLHDILSTTSTPVHLLGHSYGCRVMLSALCGRTQPRKVRSVTLLEPAVNYLCFAADANGQGRPGGYRPAFDRVERPIFSTFSSKDVPLAKTFHFAVRRDRDLGEAVIAAAETAPSRFAALGGYGPGGLAPSEVKVMKIAQRLSAYGDLGAVKVVALDGSDGRINSHGDVRNEFTQWAHLNLVSPERL